MALLAPGRGSNPTEWLVPSTDWRGSDERGYRSILVVVHARRDETVEAAHASSRPSLPRAPAGARRR